MSLKRLWPVARHGLFGILRLAEGVVKGRERFKERFFLCLDALHRSRSLENGKLPAWCGKIVKPNLSEVRPYLQYAVLLLLVQQGECAKYRFLEGFDNALVCRVEVAFLGTDVVDGCLDSATDGIKRPAPVQNPGGPQAEEERKNRRDDRKRVSKSDTEKHWLNPLGWEDWVKSLVSLGVLTVGTLLYLWRDSKTGALNSKPNAKRTCADD